MTAHPFVPVFYHEGHHKHNPPYEYDRGFQIPYQETPRRIEAAREVLTDLPFTTLVQNEGKIPESILFAVHKPELVQYLENTVKQAEEWQKDHLEPVYITPWIYPLKPQMRKKMETSPDPSGCFAFDLYAPVGIHTWQAVYQSAALAYQAAQVILTGETKQAYALCRPPGHHAGPDYTGGYCYLNNAAIAAQTLLPLGRGTILDIDYHHGNGTQEIFWDRAEVSYCSIHADPVEEYPFYAGFKDEVGGAGAPGSNLNLPLPMRSGNEAYLEAFETAISFIRERGSQWLVLSAGYDTYKGDPSTGFTLTEDVYTMIGQKLAGLNLPVVVVHEGGYAVEANGPLAARLLSGLHGE